MIFGLILEFYITKLTQKKADIKNPNKIPNVFFKTVETLNLLSI